MPQDVIITPATGNVDFKAGANVTVAQLSLSQSNVFSILGNLSIGDATANVFIGDGVATVDIIFEQSGSIRALAGKTITLGQSNSSIAVSPTLTVNTSNVATAIANGGANGVGNIGSATTYFNTVFAKATSAQYADLAEMYVADVMYAPGTLVEFGGANEVTVTSQSHTTRVAGIVSTNPSYLMNAAQPGDTVVPVALTGRVPCSVVGNIEKGDRLVASDLPGVAQRLDPDLYQPGCIVGKALENYNSDSPGTIEVAVGRT